jgi:predicted TIM-barrel fold metal-dependent hydrolase
MLIVDAQVHTWAANSPDRPWPAGRETPPQKPYPVTPERIIAGMDEAGVDRAILVPPSWEGDRNDVALAAAARYPDRFRVMGRIPLESPNPAAVAAWREQPGMLGIRLTFHAAIHRQALTHGTAEWLFTAAEAAAVPLMVFCPGAVGLIEGVAERHPRLRFTIDHLALFHGKDAEAFAGLPDVLRLARLPNVAVKASALPCYSSEQYPFPGLHGYIRQVVDTFGPHRTFWGTDWTRLPCTWREAITLFTEELPWLRGEDLELVMGQAICDWLEWPPPGE